MKLKERPKRPWAISLVLTAGLLLAGCAGAEIMRQRDEDNAVNNIPPKNPKAEILALMRTYLNDPTGVREAAITEPVVRTVQNADRYALCLRYNARGNGGRYAGAKDSVVTFRQGRLDKIVDNGRELCKDAAYQPFPELESLTR